MKKNVILLITMLSIYFVQSQQTGNLVIESGTNNNFILEINNKVINSVDLQDIRVTDLPSGIYEIKISFGRMQSIKKNIYIPPTSEIVYAVYPSDRRNPKGVFVIKDVYPIDNNLPYFNQNMIFSWGNSGQNSNVNNNQNNTNINININNQNINTPNDVVYVQGYQGNIGCVPPVTPERFENMLHTVENQSFESTKLSTAKQIIKYNNCMTVNQLVQIIRLFDFDNTKLKLAKFAYDYIYDIENFYKVNNVFDFDSTKSKLAKFLEEKD